MRVRPGLRRRVAPVLLVALLVTGCSGTVQVAEQADDPARATPMVVVEPTPVPSATPTVVPSPTRAPEPTATAVPTPEPTATAEPTPAPTPTREPTPTPAPTEPAVAPPGPTPTVAPAEHDGPVRALRTDRGVMLTVRSAGPPWQVTTPCHNIATATRGLEIEGPVDVLLDPGHGGDETGAVAPNGLVESDVNLKVAERVRDLLADRGLVVLLTRYSDHRMAIQARADLANALAPRIFVSIHHNGGFPDPVEQPGTEVFVQRDDAESQRLGGLLFEEIQAEFAGDDIAWVGTDALGVSWRVNERGTDLYGVLRRTPGLVSVLTEAMYMTEPAEAALLAVDTTLDREAEALARGIQRFLETNDPGTGFIEGLVFRGELGTGGGTDGCVDPQID